MKQHFQGRVIDVITEQVTLPNGHEMEMELVRHPGGAASVALDDQRQVCLIHQYRHAVDQWLWELPAGKLDPPEVAIQAAQRELEEEAGLQARHWCELGVMYSSPGVYTERVYLYLATGLTRVTAQPHVDEVFELHWLPFEEALEWAQTGKISDAKTVIGLCRTAGHLNRA